uniref:Uncharacterized protein n=1 Tax=Cacopsylla melanoneura TaxID=428564 RepID=A0A8D8YCG5_9HEMI
MKRKWMKLEEEEEELKMKRMPKIAEQVDRRVGQTRNNLLGPSEPEHWIRTISMRWTKTWPSYPQRVVAVLPAVVPPWARRLASARRSSLCSRSASPLCSARSAPMRWP